ncbi:hypothetical protein [Nitrospira sp. Nam74]
MQHRDKPAIPFGARYRIIDFTLSNCLNSGSARSPSSFSTSPIPWTDKFAKHGMC